MKKLFIFSALFFLLSAAISYADFNLTQWKYYKDISSSAGESLAKVTLDDEVFSGAKKELSDLRIVDSENKEVPFTLVSGKDTYKSDRMAVKMINKSFVPGQNSQVILDLGNTGSLTNNLTINTDSENFQRNVTVFGGNDMASWSVIKDNGYIYDFTDKKASFKSQNTEINFSDSAYRYLKVEIADEGENPVRIITVETNRLTRENQRGLERRPQVRSAEKAEKKLTEVVADLGASGIPTSRATLNTSSANFNRAILIYASNTENENDWGYLGQGYIFRYNTPKFNGENLTVNFPETNKRFVKIEVINKDDTPLSISGISTFSIYREILFQAKSEEKYRLFYGNPKANYPQYDLEKYFEYLEPNRAALVKLDAQKDNSGYVPEKEPIKPLTERIPYLLSGILIVTSLLLIFLVFKFLKK